jgi:phage protein D
MIELSINPQSMASAGNTPRAQVMLNGVIIPFVSFAVNNNTYYVADTFRLEIASNLLPTNITAIAMSYAPQLFVDIQAGFPAIPTAFSNAGLTELFYGQVDDFSFDPIEGMITLSGRDLTARFIDNKTTEKFVNLTSSQIATQLATRRSLTPVVTATTTKVGKYYEIDQTRLTKEMTEWDLLTYLAREEDFIVYVQGQSLYFMPAPKDSQTPYVIQFNQPFFGSGSATGNIVDLTLSRNLTLAKDVIVEVRSWNQKQAKAFTVTAKATHNKSTVLAGAAQPTGEAQTYVYTYPNLTKQQALIKAQQLLKNISQHEMKLHATLPADNILNKTQIIKLAGTGTAWDQIYYPDSIVRDFSMSGYTMTVSAKNHSPITQTIA